MAVMSRIRFPANSLNCGPAQYRSEMSREGVLDHESLISLCRQTTDVSKLLWITDNYGSRRRHHVRVEVERINFGKVIPHLKPAGQHYCRLEASINCEQDWRFRPTKAVAHISHLCGVKVATAFQAVYCAAEVFRPGDYVIAEKCGFAPPRNEGVAPCWYIPL
jgi:hypothetical protein